MEKLTIVSSFKDIVDIIKNDKSINFLSYAITPWHAHGNDAAILFLESNGMKINGIIIIDKHFETGFAIDPSYFVNTSCKYYYIDKSLSVSNNIYTEHKTTLNMFQEVFSLLCYCFGGFFSMKQKFVLAAPGFPKIFKAFELYKIGRKVNLMTTEEGVATYMGTLSNKPNFKTCLGVKDYLYSWFKQVFIYNIVWYFHGHFSSRVLLESFRGLIVNNSIIKFYKQVFFNFNNSHNVYYDKNLIQKSIIVCTTAWKRSEIVEEEDFRVLKSVCVYLRENGYSMLLKSHPRDTFFLQRFNELGCCDYISQNHSIESICTYARPLAIISFSSTALLTPHIFWNIPVFCITDMLDRSKISDFYLNEIDSFKNSFKRLVKFVDKVSEIKF